MATNAGGTRRGHDLKGETALGSSLPKSEPGRAERDGAGRSMEPQTWLRALCLHKAPITTSLVVQLPPSSLDLCSSHTCLLTESPYVSDTSPAPTPEVFILALLSALDTPYLEPTHVFRLTLTLPGTAVSLTPGSVSQPHPAAAGMHLSTSRSPTAGLRG